MIIDAFSKFVRLYPCRSAKSDEMITSFTSANFKEFLKNESVKLTLVASGTPRANGQVEIVNKSIVPMLAILTELMSRLGSSVTKGRIRY